MGGRWTVRLPALVMLAGSMVCGAVHAEPPPDAAAKPEAESKVDAKPGEKSAVALKLEPGKPVALICQTRAVSVADEAQATTGSIGLRLQAAASTEPAKPGSDAGPAGTWSITDVPATHVASFALKHREACGARACPFETGHGDSVHLWAPEKVMPEKLPQGASMSLGALDLAALTLRVSTFRDGSIAALEQGDCKPAP